VGLAVNQAVVVSMLLIFATEVVVSSLYFVLVPPRI
jgi:ABC-type transporter Mla maintaining outer membrane lipid asymmetry permease subunit MlaE